jgi:bacterioferritin-associated ferredoxin
MYVCLCKAVTDRQIKETVLGGADTFRAVRQELGVATQCGKCCQMAKSIIETTVRNTQFTPAA